VAPRNEMEQKLVTIWEEVLQRDKIGIKENFFELGGHSLKALVILNTIEHEFNVKLKIDKLFTNPTVEFISNEIKAKQWIESSKESNNDERETLEL
jgi:acyl carrier protein